jgi:hypothetical protein
MQQNPLELEAEPRHDACMTVSFPVNPPNFIAELEYFHLRLVSKFQQK